MGVDPLNTSLLCHLVHRNADLAPIRTDRNGLASRLLLCVESEVSCGSGGDQKRSELTTLWTSISSCVPPYRRDESEKGVDPSNLLSEYINRFNYIIFYFFRLSDAANMVSKRPAKS